MAEVDVEECVARAQKCLDNCADVVTADMISFALVQATVALVAATERQTRALVAIHNAQATSRGNGAALPYLSERDYV